MKKAAFQSWIKGSSSGRFPLLRESDLDSRQREVIRSTANQRLQGKDGNGLAGQVGFQANHPDMLAAWLPLAVHSKRDCLLAPDTRELIILLAARLWSCPYLWSSHEAMGRDAGLSDSSIRALSLGKRPGDLSPANAAVLDYVVELSNEHAVSDATFGKFREHVDLKQSLDVIAVLGFYTMVCMFTNTSEHGPTRDAACSLEPVADLFGRKT